MIGFLVLVSFEGSPPSDTATDLVHERIGEGFLGASIWVGVGEAETAILLIHFADRQAADGHLRARIEKTEGPPQTLAIPPTVRHLAIEHAHGRTLDTSPVGSYASLFHTLAGPGYGEVAGRELDETLESIEPLEGYAGHLRGFDVALEDEVWALVFWNAPPVVPSPPEGDDVSKIAHYRRLR